MQSILQRSLENFPRFWSYDRRDRCCYKDQLDGFRLEIVNRGWKCAETFTYSLFVSVELDLSKENQEVKSRDAFRTSWTILGTLILQVWQLYHFPENGVLTKRKP